MWKISVKVAYHEKRTTKVTDDSFVIKVIKWLGKQILKEITNTVNQIMPQPLSSCTVRRHLCSHSFTRKKIYKTTVISKLNRIRRVSCCKQNLTWNVIDNWKRVRFTDGTQVVNGQNNKVYTWRRPDEIWQPVCLGGGRSQKIYVMFWSCISSFDGNIDSQKYTAS